MELNKSSFPLDLIICTQELNWRPSRAPDYAAENEALLALAQTLVDAPHTILQALSESILALLEAGSAGLSLLAQDEKQFRWSAIAGMWRSHLGGCTSREFGPCGDVLNSRGPILFKHFERRYPYLLEAKPLAEECLMVPFYVDQRVVGTLWAIAHDGSRRFDTEDLRQLERLGRFATTAYMATQNLDAEFGQSRTALNNRRSKDAAVSPEGNQKLFTRMRKSEERYRALFESINEGFCIIERIEGNARQPLDFLYIEANRAFAVHSGLHDVVGKTLREMIPDDCEEWLQTYDTVCRTGEPIRFQRRLVSQERVLELHAFRLKDELRCYVGVSFKDITERQLMEHALRQNEEHFRALFHSGPLAMYSCDAAGTIQDYNEVAAELWGRAPKRGATNEKFCGALKVYLMDGTYVPPEQTAVAAILNGEIAAARNLEVIAERPDGSRINVIANIVPIKNAEGVITGAINCFYDITERNQLVQKTQEQAASLAELSRRKDEFLAMLSHELRNPLAAISNAVKILQLHQNDNPIDHQASTIIERQVANLKHLVDDLLEVSRISTGQVQLRPERIAVNDVVESALDTARPLIMQRRHKLSLSLPSQDLWLYADAARLEQVVVNLLTNAAKYTDEGGRLWLSVERERDIAVLRVRDTGIGIPAEQLPHIFDMFSQVVGSRERAQGGLGIGLCLVQRLVALHGGSVEVNSVLGKGSEFIVCLPLMRESESQLPVKERLTESSARPDKCRRVLVVDDNEDGAKSLATLLQALGHDVMAIHDGLDALKMALDFCPDIMILDIGLPGLSGLEVAKRIRAAEVLQHIVLVAMTGFGQETDRANSQEAGFNHHLVKPADFNELRKILEAQ